MATMSDKYILRVTAGPSYDPEGHVEVPVNRPAPVRIAHNHMDIDLSVRIQGYSGLPLDSPSSSPYFETEPHVTNDDRYSICFRFTPKAPPPRSEPAVEGSSASSAAKAQENGGEDGLRDDSKDKNEDQDPVPPRTIIQEGTSPLYTSEEEQKPPTGISERPSGRSDSPSISSEVIAMTKDSSPRASRDEMSDGNESDLSKNSTTDVDDNDPSPLIHPSPSGILATDLQFGNDFAHPIRDRLPPGFNSAMSIVKWWIDPGLEGDAYSDTPHLYGPALSSINTIHVGSGLFDEARGGLWFEEGGDEAGVEWRTGRGAPEGSAERMKWALTTENKENWVWEWGRCYGADFFNPYLDFRDFSLRLPGFSFGLMRYLDNGPVFRRAHHLRYVLRNRRTGVTYMVIVFTLHRREDVNEDGTLKPMPVEEEKSEESPEDKIPEESSSSSEDSFEDADEGDNEVSDASAALGTLSSEQARTSARQEEVKRRVDDSDSDVD